MNKLSLFKTHDLVNVLFRALIDYSNYPIDGSEYREGYEFDVNKNDDNTLEVRVLETSEHYPWQVGDVTYNLNNTFKITIESV